MKRYAVLSNTTPPLRWCELHWPTQLAGDAVVTWLSVLCGYAQSCGAHFVVYARRHDIRFYVVCTHAAYTTMVAKLQHFVPDIQVLGVEPLKQHGAAHCRVEMRTRPHAPLINLDASLNDALLSDLSLLRRNESIVIDITLCARRKGHTVPSPMAVRRTRSAWHPASQKQASTCPRTPYR